METKTKTEYSATIRRTGGGTYRTVVYITEITEDGEIDVTSLLIAEDQHRVVAETLISVRLENLRKFVEKTGGTLGDIKVTYK